MCALILLAFVAVFGVGVLVPVSSTTTLTQPTAIVMSFPTLTPVQVSPTPTALATAAASATPTALVEAPQLVSCDPIQESISRALVDNYHSDFLNEARGWTYTPSESPLKTVGTWLSNESASVAYLELLHYDCGIPPNAVDDYFNAANFPIFFSSYDRYELILECARGDQRHFIFETAYQGTAYEARYWFEPLAPTRLAMFSLFSPVSEGASIRRLVRDLYPDLPDCRTAGAG